MKPANWKFFNLKEIDLQALMASGRQCGVAFVVAGAAHGFLGPGPVGESFFAGVIGVALIWAGSIQISGGNTQ